MWGKKKGRGACLCICSPLGRSLLPGFKSSKQCPLHLPKARTDACSSLWSSFTACQTPLSAPCNSFLPIKLQRCKCVPSSAAPWHGASDPAPCTPALSSPPGLALTPQTGIPHPPPTRGKEATVDRCCALESQPLMGNGGESEREGREGGRREENPAGKEWHHLCSEGGRETGERRERDGMGGGRDEDSRGKLH